MQHNKVLGVLMATLATACGGPGTGGDAETGSSDVVAESTMPAGQEYFFVLDQLKVDATDDPAVKHSGFNLDNLYSAVVDANGCSHDDFFSLWDNDQHCTNPNAGTCSGTPGCAMAAGGCTGGVDNQMPTLANTISAAGQDVRATLTDMVGTNRLAMIVRVGDVNDLTTDSDVTVQAYLAYPTFTMGCGSVMPNREYTIAQSSLRTGQTDFRTGAIFSRTGSIVAGRLVVPASTGAGGQFTIPLNVQNMRLDLVLNSTQIRFDINASSIGRGALGGWVNGNDIVNTVAMLAPQYRSVVEQALGGMVDIQVNNVCDSGPLEGGTRMFGGLSLALEIHGVPATISTTTPVASMQAMGTCGATAPTDGGTTTDAATTDATGG